MGLHRKENTLQTPSNSRSNGYAMSIMIIIVQLTLLMKIKTIKRSPPPATERGQNPTTSTAKGQPMRKQRYLLRIRPQNSIPVQWTNSDQYLKVHVVKGQGDKKKKKKKNITRGNKQFHPDLNRKTATKVNISLAFLTQGFPFVEHRRHQPIYTCRPYWKIITHAMNTGAALHHSKRTITIRTAKIRDKFYNKTFNYN